MNRPKEKLFTITMALFLANTTIYHPGRTAGHWVRKSLALRNLIVGCTPLLHDTPPEIRHRSEVRTREYSVSFVRHPAHWVRFFNQRY